MRIIHDIEGRRPQVTASVKAYTSTTNGPPKYTGARAEVLIVDCSGDTKETFEERDAIYIEGRIDGIRHALQTVLRLLDLNERHERERIEKIAARSVQCPACQSWYDPKSEWHADGKGNQCPEPQVPYTINPVQVG